MRFAGACLLVIWASGCAFCATVDADSAAVLERLRSGNETSYSALKAFVCDESIQRYRSTLDGSRPRAIDTVTASLSFENGAEHYSDVRQNAQSLARISNLIGAWSEGEFGTLLRQTNQLMRAEHVTFDRGTTWDGETALLYAFDVPASDSPWELVIDGRSYRLAFRTQVWVSETTAQIIRVVRTASDFDRATGVSAIQWTLNLRPVRMLGKEWLLPATAQYSVSYAQNNRREWNEIGFTHYRRYGSEVALRFDTP